MDYLKELNPEQRVAVENYNGPMLVIAGPGSGKTRVLTYRIAHMMSQGVDPFNILALTFTNKAAREMKERIEKIVGQEARNLYMGTFHSVFARILRSEGHRLGYPSNFSIYDTDDAKSLIKTIVKEQALNDQRYKPNIVYNRISAAKNSLITAGEYMADLNLRSEDEVSGRPKIAHIYELYSKRCFQAGAMDFDDLLLKMYQLLKQFPDALYKYQNKFKYILIDEFQDTNHAQYQIIKMLGDMFENICTVGDDAQSIYAFRGANIQNILNLEKDYPDLKTVKLEQNYRSTKHIVTIANEVITKNRQQLPKVIWTANEEGQKIRVIKAMSDNEEGKLVADSIFEEKLRNHFKNEDFAILYRTNAQSRSFEEAFRKLNIPYRVYGGLSFYQRKEVKDFLAYLRIIINSNDEEALKRIINYPARGIGKTTIEKLIVMASEKETSIWSIIEDENAIPFTGKTKNSLTEFVVMIKSFATLLATKDAYEIATQVAQSTGIVRELYNDKSLEGQSRYENLQELLNSIKEFTAAPPVMTEDGEVFTDLGSYLQQVSLITDMDNDSDDTDKVKLMSIHSAKGLEFPVVYVVGLEENLFPGMMSLNSREDLEEERRLFYVAITRAMKKLYLAFAGTRFRFGTLVYCEPSRFLDELPPTALEILGGSRRPPVVAPSPKFGDLSRRTGSATPVSKPKTAYTNAPQNVPTHIPSEDFHADDPEKLQNGMEVEHQKFGFGKVVSIEGQGGSKIGNIFFQNVGTKRIMLKYAKLKILKKDIQ